MVSRPNYNPNGLPPALAAAAVAAARQKWVWLDSDGVAWWINDEAKARNNAERHGGVVFPPVS